LFHNTWFARYSRPQFIVFDNGGEFKREFKQISVQDNYGDIMVIKPNRLTVTSNKQVQSLSEYTKMSMTGSNHLTWKIIMKERKYNHCASTQRCYLSMIYSSHLIRKVIMKMEKEIIHLINTFNHLHGHQAIRNAYYTTLHTTPGKLVFGRNLIHNNGFKSN
jgi:hypothetical protein